MEVDDDNTNGPLSARNGPVSTNPIIGIQVPQFFFLFLTWAHKLQSFGLAGTATKRAKSG
ncbi:BQ2448_7756 [Microbotryum intermedium]|uniref:BQ2448_7756 protein n=1 Tax=Microbotryum intermedium TaxID=269621 RepID=A0A238FN64_9BASI|nr:BQ2448_7756 [Microbotryum intermedium]